ncbi:xanthine dehydrogenase family protein molybdopterin-binding subunit [Solirubrobacter sp. CPCC 204708]|uniref:Xanthine dehydrogenase family protein molybdopterin-binding subunit n=1 Tax=Solirubrobacter deserti TaxID=2282478 RepID=A0ABT4RV13_9ACTN|nr:xanthine dehydrogenase family protein molybdopterin-binding subunit [Solirubrobacter deserti]MBE2320671.1 xanthine dehydrogenase family protein molybdopterin-binding subunit [Solirubrobacter deserti]MDA0142424.1 xanthine dehydrogenase family protein molybdopterin-binding subunit [Solirubrobacter deserti]
MKRVEDPPFLRGARPYTDDVRNEGALYAVFVRSGIAHGLITSIDADEARAAPGVVGVYTAADLNLGPFPTAGPPVDTPEEMRRPMLASGRVRFVGEPVVVVVAETRAQAVDASQLVWVDYEDLPVLVDMTKALDADAPLLFPDAPNGNLAATGPTGEDALSDAEVRVGARLVNQRVAAVPMEPSAALAMPDPDVPGGFILYTPSQGPHAYQGTICASTGLEKEQLRVISTATGGGFGARIACYPEQVVVVALARELGRAVRYVETRSETMLEMQHGRAQVQDVEIGGTRDGKVTGLRVRVIADAGAYPADAALMPMLTGLMSSGVYEIPKIDFHFDCVVTNTTPIGAYRGAGRPEATALVERAIDMFAAEIGMDPAEVRRKNFITEFPHQTVMGANYDSGEYVAALDNCLANAGYEGLRAEQAQRRQRGDVKQLGLGLCSYVEWTGFGSELGTCTVQEDGTVLVTAGTSSHGQGHETSYAQLVSGTLGIPMRDIKVVQSDTKLVKRGAGTMGSRSLQVGGTAVQNATDDVLEKAKKLAAHLLEADTGDIQVVHGEGLAVAGSPASAIPWAELARAAADPARRPEGFEGGLESENDFETPDATYPFGTHLAVVEVDVETGMVDLVRHITVDDAGRIANPMLVEGQVHGGIAQGVAQALFEEIAFDEDGNNVTANLASYAIPSAGDLPNFETERTQTPTPRNPLGAKGIGEAGAIGATPAAWNAVIDALSHMGVRNIDMPATPQRVWQAISAAAG